jgi:hypothetical protein
MKDLWVSEEGTFGTGSVVLVDTKNWLEEDWVELDECRDWDRMQTAIDISNKRDGKYEYA